MNMLRDLTPDRRRFVEMVTVDAFFGQVKNLLVSDGQPVLSPPPEIYEDYKVGLSSRRSRRALTDSTPLSRAWVDFFQKLDEIGTGQIDQIDFADGEPKKVRSRRGVLT